MTSHPRGVPPGATGADQPCHDDTATPLASNSQGAAERPHDTARPLWYGAVMTNSADLDDNEAYLRSGSPLLPLRLSPCLKPALLLPWRRAVTSQSRASPRRPPASASQHVGSGDAPCIGPSTGRRRRSTLTTGSLPYLATVPRLVGESCPPAAARLARLACSRGAVHPTDLTCPDSRGSTWLRDLVEGQAALTEDGADRPCHVQRAIRATDAAAQPLPR